MKYTATELKVFEELITAKMEATKEECRDIKAMLKELSDTSTTEDGDSASRITESDTLAVLLCRKETYLDQLKAAFWRTQNGTFGICQASGKLIPKERLYAHLCASMSVSAKDAAKAKEGSSTYKITFTEK